MDNGRPRGEGQKRGQILPRYWPRISDQELQQMSGDSNSVVTPLFEKMLSASDAGRIGRLVLPKQCAEAYFPPISQPEGLPLKVQDAKGKDWVFQFRFWPNNNSRLYVLEGVTPYIQSMELQAGDIVTFNRLDPEGKLVMGFRKPLSVASEQEAPVFAKPTLFTTNHAGSSCSSVQELTTEQRSSIKASSRRTRAKEEKDTVDASEGLDALANLAILGEGDALDSSAQPTRKHPRHRPGCSCIVCIQPPSRKGPKHKQHRFRTLRLQREKRQSEKEAESAQKKQELQPSVKPELTEELASNQSNDDSPNLKTLATEVVCDDPSRRKSSSSPSKGYIDLNIQSERGEEPLPVSDSGSMMRLLQERLVTPVGNGELTISHVETIGGAGGKRPDTEPHVIAQPDADVDRLVPISMPLLASTSEVS